MWLGKSQTEDYRHADQIHGNRFRQDYLSPWVSRSKADCGGPMELNEKARLQALRRYKILDTDPEKSFDDPTILASHICRTFPS
jgi:hypothetical protein